MDFALKRQLLTNGYTVRVKEEFTKKELFEYIRYDHDDYDELLEKAKKQAYDLNGQICVETFNDDYILEYLQHSEMWKNIRDYLQAKASNEYGNSHISWFENKTHIGFKEINGGNVV